MSAFFCSHLRRRSLYIFGDFSQLTGVDCLDRETGQLRLTVGREEDTTEQLGLHKMWMVRCFNLMESPGNGCGNIRAI